MASLNAFLFLALILLSTHYSNAKSVKIVSKGIKRPEIHNPLQRINVRETRLQESSTIVVSIDRYEQYDKFEWFNVSWSGVENPAYDDWIALMIPADANMSEVAPAKWRLAAECDSHIPYGNGTLSFRLISYRSDVSFVFVQNGFSSPIAVARSPTLRLTRPNLPLQGHLALTGVNSEMQIQWNTRDRPLNPEVRWGVVSGVYSSSATGRSFTYTRNDLCGADNHSRATHEGWTDPGMQNVATMTNLLPGLRYYYIYGDEAFGFSEEASFLSAPEVSPNTTVRILAIADLGQAEIDGSMQGWQMSPSLTTTALLELELSNSLAQEGEVWGGDGNRNGNRDGDGKAKRGETKERWEADSKGGPGLEDEMEDVEKEGRERKSKGEASLERGSRQGTMWGEIWKRLRGKGRGNTLITGGGDALPLEDEVITASEQHLLSSSSYLSFSSSSPSSSSHSSATSSIPSSLPAVSASTDGRVTNPGYSLLLHNGDISYAQGFSSQWDNFFHQIEPLVTRMPYMVAPGNHERDWPGSGDRYAVEDSGGECGVPYEQRIQMPLPARDQQWYAFNYGPVHFLQISTEHDFLPGSTQYDFIVRDLESVNRSRTPWLVVGAHRPIYVSSNDDGTPQSDQVVSRQLRSALEDLFLQYKVDLTLSGHHHSYQRTCPLYKGNCMGYNEETGEANAPVHVVIGNAGASLCFNVEYPFPEWIQKLEVWWGYTTLEVSGSKLVLEAISNNKGEFMDRVELVKAAM